MKKVILFFFFIICCFSLSQAQDYVVNKMNDTIPCRILEVNDDIIKYQIKSGDAKTTNTINRNYVQSFYINNNDVPVPASAEAEKSKDKTSFRVAFAIGYGNRLGETLKTGDRSLDAMTKDLKNGFNLDLEIQHFFNERCGMALNVSSVITSAESHDITVPLLDKKISTYKESQYLTFIGPAFATRYDHENWLITANIALGAIIYYVDSNYDGKKISIKSTNLGMNYALGAEYKVSPKFAAGLKIGLTVGSTDSFTTDAGTMKLDERISTSSLMLSAYCSFRSN